MIISKGMIIEVTLEEELKLDVDKFEEIMMVKFLSTKDLQIQQDIKDTLSLNRINSNNSMPTYMMIKLLKPEDKDSKAKTSPGRKQRVTDTLE